MHAVEETHYALVIDTQPTTASEIGIEQIDLVLSLNETNGY